MSATVTSLPVAKPAKRTTTKRTRIDGSPRTKPQAKRRVSPQTWQGAAYYGVGGTLLALSLDHLATGMASTMHLPLWQAAIMAVATDVGFVITETMPFTCTPQTVSDTRLVRHGFAGLMFIASAYMNTISIGHDLTALAAGSAIPAVIATCLYLANRCIMGRSR